MNNLEKIVVFFVKNFSRAIKRTELVKLIYYFEYNYRLLYGDSFCGVTFIRDKNGPFSREIPDAVVNVSDIIECKPYRTYYGNIGYKHVLRDEEVAMEVIDTIPYNSFEVAMYVIEELSQLSLDEILDVVYNTPPVAIILEKEKSLEKYCIGEEINMNERKSVVFKPGKERIEEAKKRLNLESRGSDDDYNGHLLAKIYALKEARRRADRCLLN